MRTFIFVFALAFLLVPMDDSHAQQAAQQAPAQQSSPQPPSKDQSSNDQEPVNQRGKIPVFRKNVTVVNVLFTVKDKHGTLVPNLEKDHFELLEEGKPQTIKYFSAL